jgi:hypothetical protein
MDSSDPGRDAPTAWHVSWQAAIGREIFADRSLYARVRERLIDAHGRRGRVLVDYTLLPREIHLVSQIAPGDSVGGVARAIGNVVARWVRELEPVRSPVFAGRYRAHPVASDEDLRNELRMLAWRPVILGLCATPSHHATSALRTVLGLRPAHGFDARTTLGLFGDSVQQARAAMRAWLARRPSEREVRQWELACGLALATGTVGPHAVMARELRSAGATRLVAAAGAAGIDGALALLGTWVAVRLGARHDLDLRQAKGDVGARGRALVACLATDHDLCSAASVARHFGRAKATLSEQMAARRQAAADRQILATPVQRIVEEALALRAVPRTLQSTTPDDQAKGNSALDPPKRELT